MRQVVTFNRPGLQSGPVSQALAVSAILIGAALLSGWLVAHQNWAGIGLALLVPSLMLARRVAADQWLVIWLVVGGLLGALPSIRLASWAPDASLERAAIVLPLLAYLPFLRSRDVKRIGPFAICMGLFSLDFVLMAWFASPTPGEALQIYWHHYLSAFVIFGLAVVGLDTHDRQRGLLRAALIVGGVMAVLAIVQVPTDWDFGRDRTGWENRVSGTLSSPPVLGAALATLLFFALYEAVHGSLRWRLAAVAVSGLMLIALFLTYTRAAWLSAGFGAVVLILYVLRRRPVAAVAFLAVGLVLLVIGPGFVEPYIDDPRLLSDANAIGRLDTSLISLQQFAQNPLLGWGPLTITFFDITTGYEGWVSHNSFLTLLVANGLIGGLLYLTPIVLVIGLTVRNWLSQSSTSVAPFALASAVAYLVNAAAIDMQYFSFPHTLFWLCLGLMVSARPSWSRA